MWSSFNKSLPESYLGSVGNDNLLVLLCLSVYVVLLGRCCRGWGCAKEAPSDPSGGTSNPSDGAGGQDRPQPVAVAGAQESSSKRPTMRGQLDLGTFLVGVDVSLRDLFPDLTVGMFGPLTNSKANVCTFDKRDPLYSTDVGLRVNLSSSETFADLLVALGKTLQSARNHCHFPFSTVAEEVSGCVAMVHACGFKPVLYCLGWPDSGLADPIFLFPAAGCDSAH